VLHATQDNIQLPQDDIQHAANDEIQPDPLENIQQTPKDDIQHDPLYNIQHDPNNDIEHDSHSHGSDLDENGELEYDLTNLQRMFVTLSYNLQAFVQFSMVL
jgi:hypothetical protein